MFSTKSNEAVKKKRTNSLAQFGMTHIPDDFDVSAGFAGGDDDEDDEDLEAELAALASGGDGKASRPKAPRRTKILPPIALDEVIKDMDKGDNDDDDDDGLDLEGDAELMNELQVITAAESSTEAAASITPPEDVERSPQSSPDNDATTDNTIALLKSRIEMYKQAEAQAKATQQNSKVRRFNRGLKTLNDLLRRAQAGHAIKDDEIPPEVSVHAASTPTVPSASPPAEDIPQPTVEDSTQEVEEPSAESTQKPEDSEKLVRMRERQREYKLAALECKRNGDTTMAIEFIKVIKRFDTVIKMCEDGQEVDLSDMPPPPDQFKDFIASMQAAAASPQQSTDTLLPPVESASEDVSTGDGNSGSLIDALQARLNKYKAVEETAKQEGNASKARRFGRIVKQYQEAMKACKAGKADYEYGELPIPPGFGPLPSPTSATGKKNEDQTPSSSSATPTPPKRSPDGGSEAAKLPPTPPNRPSRAGRNINEQQKKLLLERQREYKLAALQAKKAGDIPQAKEFLKICKGFDDLITAANSGLPVDMNSLPVRPSEREELDNSFSIITTEECDTDNDMSEIRIRVEEQLVKQLMMCKNTRDHMKAMGDVAGMNRFENLGLAVQRDLDVVRYSRRKDISIPKFHYERKNFNIVRCNTDLTDNELEIVVVRGINYNVANPKDVDTYVKVEFPLLNENYFRAKTNLIKDTDNPEYEQRFKVDIVRGNRQFQRLFKRHSVKFEVYSRGGFLRSDNLIGVVTVKLQPLETKCDIHNTYDLMEGRKTVGGKLEIKLRLRNPILTKQMEMLEERWLLLDS